MKDGAHTHHDHRPSGLGLIVAVVAGLLLARAIRSILPELLTVLAVTAGLTIAGLTAWAAMSWSRHGGAAVTRPDGYPPRHDDADQESARMVAGMRAELAALASHPAQQHQHLHLHGLDPDQAAAILAALRQPSAEDREGERW